jgi:hypothetical protein
MFWHVQSTQTSKMKSLFFPNVHFFYQMFTIPFEIGEDFNIDVEKGKRT